MELAELLLGIAAVFAIPAWAVWTTARSHRLAAVLATLIVVAAWLGLLLWLAVR